MSTEGLKVEGFSKNFGILFSGITVMIAVLVILWNGSAKIHRIDRKCSFNTERNEHLEEKVNENLRLMNDRLKRIEDLLSR